MPQNSWGPCGKQPAWSQLQGDPTQEDCLGGEEASTEEAQRLQVESEGASGGQKWRTSLSRGIPSIAMVPIGRKVSSGSAIHTPVTNGPLLLQLLSASPQPPAFRRQGAGGRRNREEATPLSSTLQPSSLWRAQAGALSVGENLRIPSDGNFELLK